MAKKVLTPEQAEVKAIKKKHSSMKMTGLLAILLAVILTFGVLFVGISTIDKNSDIQNTGTSTNTPGGPTNTPGGPTNTPGGTGENLDDTVSDPVYNENGQLISGGGSNENASVPNRDLPADPAEWTKEEVVYFYKAAAQRSTSAKSTQTMAMNNGMNVQLNNGALEFLIGLAEPIIKTVLKNNTLEFDGITGGYNSLVPSDAQTAKAYKEGNYTVIEMVMVEQVDNAYGDTFKGTVGHAISVVGNITAVTEQFPDWTVTFDTAFIELRYVNPVVKVRINQDGIIEKGTWSYVVDVEVKDLYIESVCVEHATTKIDYVITVGGGF